jgi:hypothetical protein
MLSTLLVAARFVEAFPWSAKIVRVAFRHRQESRRYALAPHKDTTMAEV